MNTADFSKILVLCQARMFELNRSAVLVTRSVSKESVEWRGWALGSPISLMLRVMINLVGQSGRPTDFCFRNRFCHRVAGEGQNVRLFEPLWTICLMVTEDRVRGHNSQSWDSRMAQDRSSAADPSTMFDHNGTSFQFKCW